MRDAGCLRRNRGDYTRVLSTFAHEAADALAHPAFRAPSFEGGGNEEFGRPRAVITTGAMARDHRRGFSGANGASPRRAGCLNRWIWNARDLHLAPLAGRGRKLSTAKFSGEGLARERLDAPHPLAPLATSPRKNGAR